MTVASYALTNYIAMSGTVPEEQKTGMVRQGAGGCFRITGVRAKVHQPIGPLVRIQMFRVPLLFDFCYLLLGFSPTPSIEVSSHPHHQQTIVVETITYILDTHMYQHNNLRMIKI